VNLDYHDAIVVCTKLPPGITMPSGFGRCTEHRLNSHRQVYEHVWPHDADGPDRCYCGKLTLFEVTNLKD
jgi:hypothetical protein